ncbi:hypothetical protein Tco_0857133 [Tanacetum coccineum]|uniref:Uncharacterized protein n=1 Tax=Tanacetum coccineum TaxID=301880 RepID=A0ABQ5B636_9ASTR
MCKEYRHPKLLIGPIYTKEGSGGLTRNKSRTKILHKVSVKKAHNGSDTQNATLAIRVIKSNPTGTIEDPMMREESRAKIKWMRSGLDS